MYHQHFITDMASFKLNEKNSEGVRCTAVGAQGSLSLAVYVNINALYATQLHLLRGFSVLQLELREFQMAKGGQSPLSLSEKSECLRNGPPLALLSTALPLVRLVFTGVATVFCHFYSLPYIGIQK
jgi:hypothetical protein